MIRKEQLSESNATTFNAQVLITSTSIKLLAQQAEQPECYSFRTVKHTDSEVQGLDQAFFLLPELAYPYHSLRVSVDFGSSFVLVPDDFTQQGMEPEVWLAQQRTVEALHPMVESIGDLRCSIVYSLPEEVYEFCNRSFVVPQFYHPIRPTMEMAVRHSRMADGIHMTAVLHADEGYMDAMLVTQGQVKLCNRYSFRNEVDILYYLTSLWRQHEMQTPRDYMYIFGDSDARILQALVPHLQSAITHLHVNDYSFALAPDTHLDAIRTSEPHLPESFIFAQLL